MFRVDDEDCCGKCRFHCADNSDWYCDNPASDDYTDYTPYNHLCEHFDKRAYKQKDLD